MKRKKSATSKAVYDTGSLINVFVLCVCLLGGLSWWWFFGTMLVGTLLNIWSEYLDEKDSK